MHHLRAPKPPSSLPDHFEECFCDREVPWGRVIKYGTLQTAGNPLNAKSEPFPSELSRSLNPAGFGNVVRQNTPGILIFGSQKLSFCTAWVCLSEVSTDLKNTFPCWRKVLHNFVTCSWQFWLSQPVFCVWICSRSPTMQYPISRSHNGLSWYSSVKRV